MNINKNISGTIWSTFERFSKMGIQILCTFIIAQFLPPPEFGLVSMMTIFLAFSTFLVDSGFCQALIHEKEVTEMDKSSLFWFNLLLGIIVYSIFFIIAPYIATFYNEPKLCFLIRIAFLALIFQSLIIIQQAIFFKSINFKIISKKVKKVFEKLQLAERKETMENTTMFRPWGSYTLLTEGDEFKVKRIVVNPGGKLSLQLHHKRSEHWTIVSGQADVIIDDKSITYKPNESTYIPIGVKHRLENNGTEPVVLIEVQVGKYLGEDDIERFDDIYGRE